MLNPESKNKRRAIFFGWFVLLSAFLITTVAYSMRNSFSVFYAEILKEFGWTRAETAGAFSLCMLVYGLSSPFVGAFTDRLGPKGVLIAGATLLSVGLFAMSKMDSMWLFYLLYGVVLAIGVNSLGFAVHHAYLQNWFIRRRGSAFGVLSAASGASYVLVTVYQQLISGVGWRNAYYWLAFLPLATILPLVFFFIRRTPHEKNLLADGDTADPAVSNKATVSKKAAVSLVVNKEWAETDWTLSRAVRTRQLWIMFIMNIALSSAMNLVNAHQVLYTQDRGFTALFAASIFGLNGITTVAGNLLGFLSDRFGREVTYTFVAFGASIGILALMLATTEQPWWLYIYVIFWGLFFGLGGPTQFSAVADMFSGKHYGAINGFCILGYGTGGAIGPWLGGYIFDTTKSYNLAFLAVIAAMAIACICLWLCSPRKIRLVSGKVPKIKLSGEMVKEKEV